MKRRSLHSDQELTGRGNATYSLLAIQRNVIWGASSPFPRRAYPFLGGCVFLCEQKERSKVNEAQFSMIFRATAKKIEVGRLAKFA